MSIKKVKTQTLLYVGLALLIIVGVASAVMLSTTATLKVNLHQQRSADAYQLARAGIERAKVELSYDWENWTMDIGDDDGHNRGKTGDETENLGEGQYWVRVEDIGGGASVTHIKWQHIGGSGSSLLKELGVFSNGGGINRIPYAQGANLKDQSGEADIPGDVTGYGHYIIVELVNWPWGVHYWYTDPALNAGGSQNCFRAVGCGSLTCDSTPSDIYWWEDHPSHIDCNDIGLNVTMSLVGSHGSQVKVISHGWIGQAHRVIEVELEKGGGGDVQVVPGTWKEL